MSRHPGRLGAVRITRPEGAAHGRRNENAQLAKFVEEGGKVVACRLGLSLHGAREEDLMEGVIPCHPLDMQDAM